MPDHTPIENMRRDELLHRAIKCGQIAERMQARGAMQSALIWKEHSLAYCELAKNAHR